MIGRLTGKLLEKQMPSILLDVNGVGYDVSASMSTIYKLPELGGQVTLHTHLIVREDAQILYGFYDLRERALFRALIKVNGVGPKLAITILSSIEPDSFVRCVLDNDSATLVRLPGIGKKTAERLIVEMRDRLEDWHDDEVSTPAHESTVAPDIIVRRKATQDAISALISLGYKPAEASRAVSTVETEGQTSEDLIRDALRQIAS